MNNRNHQYRFVVITHNFHLQWTLALRNWVTFALLQRTGSSLLYQSCRAVTLSFVPHLGPMPSTVAQTKLFMLTGFGFLGRYCLYGQAPVKGIICLSIDRHSGQVWDLQPCRIWSRKGLTFQNSSLFFRSSGTSSSITVFNEDSVKCESVSDESESQGFGPVWPHS